MVSLAFPSIDIINITIVRVSSLGVQLQKVRDVNHAVDRSSSGIQPKTDGSFRLRPKLRGRWTARTS